MKCGGNGRATDFFRQYGGVNKFKDAKMKYTSREAGLYLERLARLTTEDAKKWGFGNGLLAISHCFTRLIDPVPIFTFFSYFTRYPDKIVIEETEEPEEEAGPAKDDFFGNMINNNNGRSTPSGGARSSPAPQLAAPERSARMTPSPVPSVDSNTGASAAKARAESPAPVAPEPTPAPAPSSRAPAPSRLAISTTDDVSPTADTTVSPVMTSNAAPQVLAATSSLLGGSKARKGLGAKKAVKTGVSFEEAERRAKEEEERIKAEEEQRKREEEELKRTNPLAFATRGAGGGSSRLAYNEGGINTKGADEDALDRLGMGMGRLAMGAPAEKASKPAPASFGFGFDPTAPPKKGSSSSAQQGFGSTGGGFGSTGGGYGQSKGEEDEDYARKKFSNAKAISSDQYFGRGHWNDDGGLVLLEFFLVFYFVNVGADGGFFFKLFQQRGAGKAPQL